MTDWVKQDHAHVENPSYSGIEMSNAFKKGSLKLKFDIGNKVDKIGKKTIPALNHKLSGHKKTRMPKPPVIKFKKFKV